MKTLFIGIDEAWRGPWAWPLVVSAIATFDKSIFSHLLQLNDSKKLSEKQRNKLFDDLHLLQKEWKICIKTCIKSAREIDSFGIKECNRLAMKELIEGMFDKNVKNQVWIDGSDNYNFSLQNGDWWYFLAQKKNAKSPVLQNNNLNATNEVHFVIGGDVLHKIISAASIVAKVTRDNLMTEYGKDFPQYWFEKHKWYGTKLHKNAILNYGINFLHRKSYKPIKTLISWEE